MLVNISILKIGWLEFQMARTYVVGTQEFEQYGYETVFVNVFPICRALNLTNPWPKFGRIPPLKSILFSPFGGKKSP